jgi:predicted ATP-grasp superfamily ATP-dependent carboligase
MTRVFVYEFTCAAPAASVDAAGATALTAEGAAMLAAALDDFARVPGVEPFTIRSVADEERAFRAAARSADWSLVIAPEFDDILLTRCRWVLEEGGRLLGPSPAAVELCADKLALFQHWQTRGVPTPEALSASGHPPWPEWVLKPRFGAGSQEIERNGTVREMGAVGPMIVQEFVHGLAASVAFLCGPGASVALPPAEQILSNDDHFHYLGGCVPLPPNLAARATTIARQALAGVPGLCGYVGVDVVLGAAGRDWAIEINPRLTTSYLGLRQLAKSSLAAAMLRIAAGEPEELLQWYDEPVSFAVP